MCGPELGVDTGFDEWVVFCRDDGRGRDVRRVICRGGVLVWWECELSRGSSQIAGCSIDDGDSDGHDPPMDKILGCGVQMETDERVWCRHDMLQVMVHL